MAAPTRILSQTLRRSLRNPQFVHLRPSLPSPCVATIQYRANSSFATEPDTTGVGPTAPAPAAGPDLATDSPPKAPSLAREGLRDLPPLDLIDEGNGNGTVDWTRSYHGLSQEPFAREIAEVLMDAIKDDDVEVKPVDGILYLPEIKYRRILNRAFGPGGWGLAPRGETIVTEKSVTREYALVCHGRLVSIARGEQDYFDPSGIPTATEGCKSNALMRCCKDLGIASELWDPRFIKAYKKKYCVEVMTEHFLTKRRKKLWYKKGDTVEYPYKIVQ